MPDQKFSSYFKDGPWDPVLDWIGKMIPQKVWPYLKWIVIILLIIGVLLPNLNTALQVFINYNKVLSLSTEETPEKPIISVPKVVEEEGPVERRVYDEKREKRCNGAVFDIVKDLEVASDVERLRVVNLDDPEVVTVEGTKNFQGAYQSSFECNLPFVATISATPQGGTKSLGLFFEFRDIFKVLIGDGDMRAVKIQGNNKGERSEWGIISRQYLPKELEVGKEV